MDQVAVDGGAVASGMVSASALDGNARDLEVELLWFARLLDTRFKLYFEPDSECTDIRRPGRPFWLCGLALRHLRASGGIGLRCLRLAPVLTLVPSVWVLRVQYLFCIVIPIDRRIDSSNAAVDWYARRVGRRKLTGGAAFFTPSIGRRSKKGGYCREGRREAARSHPNGCGSLTAPGGVARCCRRRPMA